MAKLSWHEVLPTALSTCLHALFNCFQHPENVKSFACHVVAILHYSTGTWQQDKNLPQHTLPMCM